MKTVESEVPFGDALLWWIDHLHDDHGLLVSQLSHEFDRSYLAWETVRLSRNPFFSNGTGFEGYWVGLCQSSDAALDQLLQLGRGALESQARLFRYREGYRRRLARALQGEGSDLEAMAEWSIELGAILGRLRCNLYKNPQAGTFRHETYRQVEGLPPIAYREEQDDLQQMYEVRDADNPAQPLLYVDPNHLRTTDQEAWDVVASLGKFGHPLVREILSKRR
ncbi:MAG: hypothetical protein M9936_12515 [Caldilinea sp.]|nr:hypothetical protein [Caldilinea sp.]MCB0149353.1 hypothetical protein [Caldilineaceae bacterium]MCB0042788.1 hypothetical protein [Caldilinea sp.]MCB9114644.1 hypothetical protein [Caldilineaceae bacterium]MCB9120250.1 hypothetical protein [Caldilineaceae bacterium]